MCSVREFSGQIIEDLDQANSEFILLVKKPENWALYKKLGERYFRLHFSEFIFFDINRGLSAVVNCSSLVFFPIYVPRKCQHGPPGCPGTPGQDGPPGNPGLPGQAGSPGLAGFPGQNGSVGSPGPDGKSGNSGTEGSDGSPGIPGNSGLTGLPGFPGRNGSDGLPGMTMNGASGTPGLPGADGTEGSNGTPGSPGIPGADGSSGIDGFPGAPGLPGVNGNPGIPGSDGSPGPPGKNGSNGSPGDPGASLQGNPGSSGSNGIPGLPGLPGLPGRNGNPGKDGSSIPGSPGLTGIPGAEGLPGNPGSNGLTGNQGAPGLEGTPGTDGSNGSPGDPGPEGFPGNPGTPGINGSPGFVFTSPTFMATNNATTKQTITGSDTGSDSYVYFSNPGTEVITVPQSGEAEITYYVISAPTNLNYISFQLLLNDKPVPGSSSFGYTAPGVAIQVTGRVTLNLEIGDQIVLANNTSDTVQLNVASVEKAKYKLSKPGIVGSVGPNIPSYLGSNNSNLTISGNQVSTPITLADTVGSIYVNVKIQSSDQVGTISVYVNSNTYSLTQVANIQQQFNDSQSSTTFYLVSAIFFSDILAETFAGQDVNITASLTDNVNFIAIEAMNILGTVPDRSYNSTGNSVTGITRGLLNQIVTSINENKDELSTISYIDLLSITAFQAVADVDNFPFVVPDNNFLIQSTNMYVNGTYFIGADLSQSQLYVVEGIINNPAAGIVYFCGTSVCINTSTPTSTPYNGAITIDYAPTSGFPEGP